MTVLSIDDSSDDTLLLQRACRRANVRFSLRTLDDGTKAIAYLSGADDFSDRSRHPLPDLLLLDLKMPLKSGFDVLDWLRSQQDLKTLLVAVLTSSHHDADVRQAYDKGANAFLTKPVGYEELIKLAAAVDTALESGFLDPLRQLPAYKPPVAP